MRLQSMKAKAVLWFLTLGIGWVGGLIAGFYLAKYLIEAGVYSVY